MDQNNEPIFTTEPDTFFEIKISKKELDLVFKFLSRSDLKGYEVPEFNKLLDIFNPSNLQKNKLNVKITSK
jgi:hypothetical protein